MHTNPSLGTRAQEPATRIATIRSRRELATRVNGGLQITLYWDSRDNSTSVDLYHAATGETISFRVPPGRALDAFHHPFAHLGHEPDHDPQPDHIGNPSKN
jgi:hypothetical protein